MSNATITPEQAKTAVDQLRDESQSLRSDFKTTHDEVMRVVTDARDGIENLRQSFDAIGEGEELERREKQAQAFADVKETLDKVNQSFEANEAKRAQLDELMVRYEERDKRLDNLEQIVKDFGTRDAGSASGGIVHVSDEKARLFDVLKRGGHRYAIPGAEERDVFKYMSASPKKDWTMDQVRQHEDVYWRHLASMIDQQQPAISIEERATFHVQDDAAGGMFVPVTVASDIIQRVFETSPIRQFASVQTVRDRYEQPRDLADAAAVRGNEHGVGDTAAITRAADFGTIEIDLWDLYADVLFTQRLLYASDMDIEAYVTGKVADQYDRRENRDFVVGTGVGEPRGIATYPTEDLDDGATNRRFGTHVAFTNTGAANLNLTAANAFDPEIEMITRLKPPYRARARWAISRLLEGEFMQAKDGEDRYRWMPGIEAGHASMLLGYPITNFEDLSTAFTTANSIVAIFGDLSAYKIIDGMAMRTLRDVYTQYPTVKLRFLKESGGGLLDFEAIKYLRIGA